ncbi:MAG: hypothetical protein ACRDYV_17260 [Acidimicrobiia bacterium]
MAGLALSLVLAKWPHIPPNGLLFGCIVIMAIGLAIAIKWPDKPPKKSND